MRINTNLIAQNTFTQYTKNNNNIASSVEKLSSGYAINSAADNAAGLAISEKMRAQIRGLDQASANAQDAISLAQTAEGALDSATEILQRMREISVQSSSDTNNDDIDRDALQDEFSQLQSELNDIASNTSFNKKNLLDGSIASTTKSVSNVSLGNNSLAITVGSANAGGYNFSVGIKQETAAIAAKKPDTASAVLTGDAKNYFKAADSATAGTYLADGETSKVTLGTNASSSALLNGNYTLSTTSKDGNLTITATGDNGQTFTANITAAQLDTLETNSANTAIAELNIEFSADTKDAFTLSLGVNNFSNTTNGINSLSDAINSATVSISGGVTAQDATYGVYASLTGGESVKLNTGDSSVTFGNGVTVSFNELSATDLDTEQYAANKMAATDNAITWGDGSTASTFSVDVTDLFGGTYSAASVVAEGTDFNISLGGTDYTYTAAAGNTQADVMTGLIGKIGTITRGATSVDFTAANSNGVLTFTGNDGSTDATSNTATSVASSGTSGTHYNFDTVFGNGTANSSKSSFSVTSAANAGLTFQVGANKGDTMTINIEKMDAQSLGVNSAKVNTRDAASAAISTVDKAINSVSSQRAYLGAIQNRLDYKIDNLDTSSENLTAAESQIRDVDMAKEMTKFTNSNILSQAATSMLAQANSLPQNVLSLLQ